MPGGTFPRRDALRRSRRKTRRPRGYPGGVTRKYVVNGEVRAREGLVRGEREVLQDVRSSGQVLRCAAARTYDAARGRE